MRKTQLDSLFNIDPETLELFVSAQKECPMAIPISRGGAGQMSPMWELVHYNYVYSEHYRQQRGVAPGKPVPAACLAPPPAWLIAIAAVMWEGILQGAAWDLIKIGVRGAVTKLQMAGIAPPLCGSTSRQIAIEAGWREYSTSSKKQYEMFLSLKRTFKSLPDRHALAYARAANGTEFGKIIRDEIDVHPTKTRSRPAIKDAKGPKPQQMAQAKSTRPG